MEIEVIRWLANLVHEKQETNRVLMNNIQEGFKREKELKEKLVRLEMELKRVKAGE